MVDDDSMGYYLLFNIPIGVYVLYFMYVYCRYGRKVMQDQHRFNKALELQKNNDTEHLVPVPTTVGGLSPLIHAKLYYNMSLQILFFWMWLISSVPNFFILS